MAGIEPMRSRRGAGRAGVRFRERCPYVLLYALLRRFPSNDWALITTPEI
jgi:hypothetical protein